MNTATREELQQAHRPITSLISKSEKAQQKLASGTWQHTMLRNNLKALQIASALMKEANDADHFTRDQLQEAIHAFAAMMSKTERAQAKFLPGTSQHSLLQNRLRALSVAQALTEAELDGTPTA